MRPRHGGYDGCAARLLAGLILSAIIICIVPPPGRAANPIVVENRQPGDFAWEAAVAAHVNFAHPPVAGYASATSVRPGGVIDFYVNVPQPARYRVEIVRLGWYGGAGGRRLTCLTGSTLDPGCAADEPGVQQPAPPPPDRVTGELAAGWGATDQLQVPRSWTTGYYLAVFQLSTGPNAGKTGFTPFIVQAPVGDRSQILVVVPTNTWQAYNTWGGRDVYTTPGAVKVSFDRPYQHHLLFYWEYPLLRFLERIGYDVSYATDDAVDRNPGILLDHKLDIAAGHGEYWTHRERNAWEGARARGVNLAFMGANTGYWQVRYEDHDRTMVSYKYAPDPDPDPRLKTVQFRTLKPPRPECRLLGVQYNTDSSSSEDGQYFDYTVTPAGARDPWFAGTGARAGTAVKGLVGFEFDAVRPACHVPPVKVLLGFHGAPFSADAVRYRACSGSEVFDAGSLLFSWGLDAWRDPDYSPPAWPPPPGESTVLQRMMRNAIRDMLVAHPRFQAAHAVRVSRHGSYLLIDPAVSAATVSVRTYAVGSSDDGRVVVTALARISHRRSVRLRLGAPRAALAVIVDVSVRTGEVSDSRRYILPTNGSGGAIGPAGELSATSCYGSSARVLTPVFGGEDSSPLRVAVNVLAPSTLTLFQGGQRVDVIRMRHRRRTPVVVTIPAAAVVCGRLSLRIAGRDTVFTLAAVRSCADTL